MYYVRTKVLLLGLELLDIFFFFRPSSLLNPLPEPQSLLPETSNLREFDNDNGKLRFNKKI